MIPLLFSLIFLQFCTLLVSLLLLVGWGATCSQPIQAAQVVQLLHNGTSTLVDWVPPGAQPHVTKVYTVRSFLDVRAQCQWVPLGSHVSVHSSTATDCPGAHQYLIQIFERISKATYQHLIRSISRYFWECMHSEAVHTTEAHNPANWTNLWF